MMLLHLFSSVCLLQKQQRARARERAGLISISTAVYRDKKTFNNGGRKRRRRKDGSRLRVVAMGVGLKENIHKRWYKGIQPYTTRVKWSRAVQGICYRDAG
jgi:hypothetical protein